MKVKILVIYYKEILSSPGSFEFHFHFIHFNLKLRSYKCHIKPLGGIIGILCFGFFCYRADRAFFGRCLVVMADMGLDILAFGRSTADQLPPYREKAATETEVGTDGSFTVRQW